MRDRERERERDREREESELIDPRDIRDRDLRDRPRDRDGLEAKRGQFTRSLSNTEAPPDEKTGKIIL